MFILNATTKSLKIVLGEAATTQPVFIVGYGDATDTALTEGSFEGACNSTTAVTLLAAPAADTRRVVKGITVYNADNVSHVVYIQHDDGSTVRTLYKFTLAAGQTWDLVRVQASSSENPFDQDLNTTDDPLFTDAVTIRGETAAGAYLTVTSYRDIDEFGGTVLLRHARGSLLSPSIVQNGDRVGVMACHGWDGAKFVRLGRLRFNVNGTPGTDDMPGKFSIDLTTDGSDTPAQVLTLDAAGNLVITGNITADNVLLNKYDATAAPTATDDSAAGYSVGSRWVDVTNDNVYTCVDATEGAAVWVQDDAFPPVVWRIPAGAWDYPTATLDPAPLDTDTGTNGSIKRHLLAVDTYVQRDAWVVPSNIDASGTVTFYAVGYATTAAASKNIQLRFGHSAVADSESWDAAYTNEDSGDLACDATQDQLDHFTWTETVSNLGWTANDSVRLRLGRIAATGNDLSGSWGLVAFEVRIPTA